MRSRRAGHVVARPLNCGVSRHSMRLAFLLVACCSFGAGECQAQDAGLSGSSVVIRLADEAIAADGDEAVNNRELARSYFVTGFLTGYANPETTAPVVNPYALYSRMYARSWTAGQAYRRAHPDSVAQIMHEYGYKDFDGAGSWTSGFETSIFRPDSGEAFDSGSKTSCWHLAIFRSPEMAEQLRTLPRDSLTEFTLRVLVRGYVSPPRPFLSSGCQQQIYATSVAAGGG
jgi:hypothetical protein